MFCVQGYPYGSYFFSQVVYGEQRPEASWVVASVREDLSLWDSFLSDFNGHSLWQAEFVEARALGLFTDAAGGFGFGAFWAGHWCSEQWPSAWVEAGVTRNITLLKLFPDLVSGLQLCL